MRRTVLALTATVTFVAGLAIATPAFAVDSDIRINEVASTSDSGVPDFIELINSGAAPVDLSGWVLRDENDDSGVTLADGLVLEPGELFAVETDAFVDGFGLGRADSARLFAADGITEIDALSWTEHVSSLGRVPDGTGEFSATTPTPGALNETAVTVPTVVINEVESNGDPRGDWIELANLDETFTANVSGWTIIDSDPTHEPIVLPEGTEIESGGYLGVVTDAFFGLGARDTVTVRDASGVIVAEYAWEAHATGTWGRCATTTGDFVDNERGTFALPNDCAVAEEPDIVANDWPFGGTVQDAVAPGTWGDDMSGLDIAEDGTVFAVNNDNAEIFQLAGGPERFTVAQSWVPTYPDGSGQPDAEGIAVAGDGSILLSTERDNTDKGVSRPSVLRVELGADGASATTHEWNLTGVTGELGANAGIEAIEWFSDEEAVALGIRDAQGLPFAEAVFDAHLGGVVVVSVEQTGVVYVLVLEEDGDVIELQSTEASEVVPVIMGLDWRAGGNELWALCDEACGNRASQFAFIDGMLTLQQDVHPPATMTADYTNEGIAIAWCGTSSATPTVFWISDSAHEGVSLRVAPGDECAAAPGEPASGGSGSNGAGTDDAEGSGGDADGTVQPAADAVQGAASSPTALAVTGNDWPAWLIFCAFVLVGMGALAVHRSQTRP